MQKGIAALEDSLAGFTKLNILLPYDPANHGPWYLLKKNWILLPAHECLYQLYSLRPKLKPRCTSVGE